MKKHFLFIFCLCPFFVCHAQRIYTCKQGEISFFSEAPLENIEAHSKNINSFLNIATKEIAFVIPIRGFKFAKALMQEHFNEKYMESDKYPNVTYQGIVNGETDLTGNGTYPVTSKGKFKIHGVEKDITQTGTITVKNNEINISCNFTVAIKDYNITIPKLLFQNIADTVLVKMSADYIPLQKK